MNQKRPTPILPRGQGEDRPLIIIMSIMSFLAALSLLLVFMGLRMSASWQNDLQSAATVQISGENQILKANEAATILRTLPGISSVSVLSEAENRALLNPWIGEVNLPDEISVPTLIRLSIDRDVFDLGRTGAALSQAGITASVDSHRQWSENLASTWRRIQFALYTLLTVILFATVVIVTFATRSVIKVRKNIIQVLGQVGAADSFIGGLFVKRFLSLGFRSAVIGTFGALLFLGLFMFLQNTGTDETGLKISIAFQDLLWLTVLAFVISAVCALTAGAAARRSIQG